MKAALTLCVALLMGSLKAQTTVNYPLSSWTTGIVSMWDATVLEFYGFSRGLSFPTLPGPTITVNEGDTVVIDMRNRSHEHHTIHLHGLDVDQANDGVPHTSYSIPHNGDTTYQFVAAHAGTYFYHCHVLSVWHVQLGMYGSVVVRAAGAANEVWTGGPAFDRESNWLTSELDKNWFDSIPPQHTLDSLHHSVAVLRYAPEYYLINGKSEDELDTLRSVRILGNTGERIHLRLGNMGYFENMIIFPPGKNALVVASDGRPLPVAQSWDTLLVRPGERYSVMMDLQGPTEDSIAVVWRDMFNQAEWKRLHVPVTHGVGIGMEELDAEALDLMVFPQPSSAMAWVQWTKPTRGQSAYALYDLEGKCLRKGRLSAGATSVSIPVADLPNGIYHLRMHAETQQGHARIVVQR